MKIGNPEDWRAEARALKVDRINRRENATQLGFKAGNKNTYESGRERNLAGI